MAATQTFLISFANLPFPWAVRRPEPKMSELRQNRKRSISIPYIIASTVTLGRHHLTQANASLDCLVEDPGTGLHRPRDYMKSLEARVAYLEGLLQQVRPEVALDHLGSNEGRDADSGPVPPVPPGPTSPPMPVVQMPSVFPVVPETSSIDDMGFFRAHRAPSVEADDHHVDVLSSEVALLCLSAAGREPHYFGPSSAVSFSRIVSATMGLASRGGSSQHSRDGFGKGIGSEVPREVPLRLPSPKLRANLSEAYFNNIHPQYPFLHKPTFEIWEETCLKASLEGDLNSVGGVSLFFVLMVSRAPARNLCLKFVK